MRPDVAFLVGIIAIELVFEVLWLLGQGPSFLAIPQRIRYPAPATVVDRERIESEDTHQFAHFFGSPRSTQGDLGGRNQVLEGSGCRRADSVSDILDEAVVTGFHLHRREGLGVGRDCVELAR